MGESASEGTETDGIVISEAKPVAGPPDSPKSAHNVMFSKCYELLRRLSEPTRFAHGATTVSSQRVAKASGS
jgi:hypothetical protein